MWQCGAEGSFRALFLLGKCILGVTSSLRFAEEAQTFATRKQIKAQNSFMVLGSGGLGSGATELLFTVLFCVKKGTRNHRKGCWLPI